MHLDEKYRFSIAHLYICIYHLYITNYHYGLKEEKHAHLASSMLHLCWDYPILCTSSAINSGQHNGLRKKAPNKCVSSAVHVDNGFWRHPKFAWLGAAFKTIGQICDTIGASCEQCHNFEIMIWCVWCHSIGLSGKTCSVGETAKCPPVASS